MFHDGKGRSLSVEEKVTILNALCASSRPAIIEESPAPAEVAEGAGLNPISNAPWDEWEIDLLIQHIQDPLNAPWLSGWSPMQVKLMLDGLAALRAAPSLTKEEWGMLNAVLDDLADGLIGPSGWATLRAKVREWAKSRP
jgi:hypothetical protein